jgi:hypothetical protein
MGVGAFCGARGQVFLYARPRIGDPYAVAFVLCRYSHLSLFASLEKSSSSLSLFGVIAQHLPWCSKQENNLHWSNYTSVPPYYREKQKEE